MLIAYQIVAHRRAGAKVFTTDEKVMLQWLISNLFCALSTHYHFTNFYADISFVSIYMWIYYFILKALSSPLFAGSNFHELRLYVKFF